MAAARVKPATKISWITANIQSPPPSRYRTATAAYTPTAPAPTTAMAHTAAAARPQGGGSSLTQTVARTRDGPASPGGRQRRHVLPADQGQPVQVTGRSASAGRTATARPGHSSSTDLTCRAVMGMDAADAFRS